LGLANAGADVAVHYGHSPEAAEQTAAEIVALGRRPNIRRHVRDGPWSPGSCATRWTFSALDVLVTNAGHLVARSPVADISTSLWQQ